MSGTASGPRLLTSTGNSGPVAFDPTCGECAGRDPGLLRGPGAGEPALRVALYVRFHRAAGSDLRLGPVAADGIAALANRRGAAQRGAPLLAAGFSAPRRVRNGR